MEERKQAKHIVYGLNDKPSFGLWVIMGFQHVLTLFGATTLVPLILGPTIGMNQVQIGQFISQVYLAMGIATLIQVFWLGSGLPIVQGSSFSFLPPLFYIINKTKDGGVNNVMQAISGALIMGGIVEAILGYGKIIGLLKKVLTPVVIGPVIMLIGFSLAGVAVNNASSYWPISIIVVLLIFIFSLVSKSKTLNILSVISAVVIGYLIALFGTLLKIFPEGHPAFVKLAAVSQTGWFHAPQIFPYGAPKWNWGFFAAILAAYFASMIESVGDYHSVSYAAGLPDPDAEKINRGIGAEGLSCVISGIVGGVGTTSYTENIGLINITGVASRYVVGMGAVILILMSLIGKFGALIATIPTPVIGGAYIALFGVIGGLGIQVLSRADLSSQRNIMIIGISVLLGLGIPNYIQQHHLTFSPTWLSGIIDAILSTGMAVAGMVAIFFDQIVPGTPEERGIRE